MGSLSTRMSRRTKWDYDSIESLSYSTRSMSMVLQYNSWYWEADLGSIAKRTQILDAYNVLARAHMQTLSSLILCGSPKIINMRYPIKYIYAITDPGERESNLMMSFGTLGQNLTKRPTFFLWLITAGPAEYYSGRQVSNQSIAEEMWSALTHSIDFGEPRHRRPALPLGVSSGCCDRNCRCRSNGPNCCRRFHQSSMQIEPKRPLVM